MYIPSSNDIKRWIRREMEKRPDYAQNPEARLGTVTAVAAGGKVTVVLDGDSVGASYACASNYYPAISDRVRLERQGNTWIVTLSPTTTLRPGIQSGINAFTVPANANNATLVVNFPVPFADTPAVHVGFTSGPGASSGWIIRAISVSATGFSAFATGTATATGFSSPIQWTAVKTGAM